MYDGLQIAEDIKFTGFDEIFNTQESSAILHRGIKLNLPFDKKAPTYESNSKGTSFQKAIPHIWDITFWEEWFDEMGDSDTTLFLSGITILLHRWFYFPNILVWPSRM